MLFGFDEAHMDMGEEEGTCEEIWHVWVQPLHHIHGIVKEEDSVVIAVEEPLEAIAKVSVSRKHTITSCS